LLSNKAETILIFDGGNNTVQTPSNGRSSDEKKNITKGNREKRRNERNIMYKKERKVS